MLRVFVALGKQMPKCKTMIEDTEEVGKLLAKYNCTLVQGGARTGLMGVVLNEFQKYSDDVVLIVPEIHKTDLEGTTSKEHYIVEGEADRLKITINTCDLIVVLPGGTGTMAELSYYNETSKSGEHNAKIVMLNTKGFYNKLFKFINYQTKCGFMKEEHFKFEVINNPKQLEVIIQKLIAEKQGNIQIEQIENDKEDLIEDVTEVAEIKPLKTSKKSTKTISNKNAKGKEKMTKPSKEPKVSKSIKESKGAKVVVKKEDKSKKEDLKASKSTTKGKKSVEVEEVKPIRAKVGVTKTQTKVTSKPKAKTKTTAKADSKSLKTTETKSTNSTTTKKSTTKTATKEQKSNTTKEVKKGVKSTASVAKKTTKKATKK